MLSKKVNRRNSIRKRIRRSIRGTADRPRLAVYRSNKDIYAQIIDDSNSSTLVAASSREKGLADAGKTTKVEQASKVGKLLAEKASASGISNVIFDRGGYLYHGRVKALADGAREGGLKF